MSKNCPECGAPNFQFLCVPCFNAALEDAAKRAEEEFYDLPEEQTHSTYNDQAFTMLEKAVQAMMDNTYDPEVRQEDM